MRTTPFEFGDSKEVEIEVEEEISNILVKGIDIILKIIVVESKRERGEGRKWKNG